MSDDYEGIWYKDPIDLFRWEEGLEAVAADLARLGYAVDAACETTELLSFIRQAKAGVQTRIDRLAPVWKAIDKWRSADWNEDRLKEALAGYREMSKG